MQKRFRIHWYDQEETVKIEKEPVFAKDVVEAEGKARALYYGKKVPAPLIYVEELK